MPTRLPFGAFGTRRYSGLLAAVVASLVCMALPPPFEHLASVGFSLVIVLQIRLLGGEGTSLTLSRTFRLLGWLALVSLWLWLLTPAQQRSSGLPLLVLLTLFEVQAYPRLVSRLSREQRVTADVLTGAFSGYLLLGQTAALVIALLESITPGSFTGLAPAAADLAPPIGSADATSIDQVPFIDIAYFAFVTLTTLGFGDVLPTTPMAKLSTIFFSVIGPLYLAVIMGVLIGRYLQQQQGDS